MRRRKRMMQDKYSRVGAMRKREAKIIKENKRKTERRE